MNRKYTSLLVLGFALFLSVRGRFGIIEYMTTEDDQVFISIYKFIGIANAFLIVVILMSILHELLKKECA